MAALTDAAPPSRRHQNSLWDSDAWSCPDPERCVRCDSAVSSPSTPAAGVVKFILDNQAAGYEDEDTEDSPDEDGERWFLVGCRRPYQYEPLAQGDVDQEGDDDDLAVLVEKTALIVADDEDERQQHLAKATTEIKKKKKKTDSSNSDDSSSSSSSSSSDSDDSSSISNTSDSSDSSSSSNSSSSDSSSSSSDSSDSSTSSDSSSSSDSSGNDLQHKKKRKHRPSNSNTKERDSCSKGGNGRANKKSHTPLVATAEDSGNPDEYDDDDDDDQSSKDVPRTNSVLSVVMKVPKTSSSHITVEDSVTKAHRDRGNELEHKNSSRQSRKRHHKRDR